MKTREEILLEIFPSDPFETDAIMRVHYWHMYCDRAETFGIQPLTFEEWLDTKIEHHKSQNDKKT